MRFIYFEPIRTVHESGDRTMWWLTKHKTEEFYDDVVCLLI